MSNKSAITASEIDGKPALNPKLRFPEFRDAAGWEAKPLGDLFSDRQETGQSDLPLLSLLDKEGIVPQENSNRKNNSNSDKSKYLRVVPGDIAYNTMRMWEGRSAYVGLEGLVSPAYTVCQPRTGAHSPFFSHYFKASQLVAQFRRYSQGLVKDTLSLKYEAFSTISVPTPAVSEQQKIADCLNSVDELIAAQAQKVDALKTQKKGLMQQLFPRKGETQPRLRFPEFRGAKGWEVKRVDERGDVLAGKALAADAPGPLRPYLRTKNVLDGAIDLSDVLTMPMTDAEFSRFELLDGDVLLNEGAIIGARGTCLDLPRRVRGTLRDAEPATSLSRLPFNVPGVRCPSLSEMPEGWNLRKHRHSNNIGGSSWQFAVQFAWIGMAGLVRRTTPHRRLPHVA